MNKFLICILLWLIFSQPNLFFSEYAEGSSNNKYLEIFIAGEENVDLGGYSLSSCSNGCDDGINMLNSEWKIYIQNDRDLIGFHLCTACGLDNQLLL